MLAERRFDTLSSGERARVLIARALATEADCLLLDEPTAALDPRYQLAIMEIAQAEARRGALVVLAAHSLELVARYATRVLVLDQGEIQADGPPGETLTPELLGRVFGVVSDQAIQPTGLRLPPSESAS